MPYVGMDPTPNREHPEQRPAGHEPTGPETWVREAIAEQEEHLKRIRPCQGIPLRAHRFAPHGRPDATGTIAGASLVSRCIACGVTETPEDYRRSRA